MEAKEYIAIFSGHNKASYLFQRLLKKTANVELVAAPCKISYGCSQGIKFMEQDKEIVLEEARKKDLKPRGVYKIIKMGKAEAYEKIS